MRLPLQRLEQAIDPAPDSPEAAELKRILLARVADLEVINPLDAEAPVSNARENSPVGPIVELAPVQIVVTEEPAQKPKTMRNRRSANAVMSGLREIQG